MTRATDELDLAVATMPAIGLDELAERAALMTRIDRKYVVPVALLGPLLADAPASTRVLEIGGTRSFGYLSTYLDSPALDSFYLAGRRRRRRFKVRTRRYLDSGGNWLEVKTRSARGATVKSRIEHAEWDAPVLGTLRAEAAGFVDVTLAGARVTATTASDLEPVLVTGYQRSTLFLPESSSRATVDVDLTWSSLRNGDRLGLPHLAVIETKTGATPSAIDRLLWRRGHRPVQLSKYGVGMAALHPELPDLKWHRTLHRHLSLTS